MIINKNIEIATLEFLLKKEMELMEKEGAVESAESAVKYLSSRDRAELLKKEIDNRKKIAGERP